MNKELNEIKKTFQYIMLMTKTSPELFHDGIGEEFYNVAKQEIRNIDELKRKHNKNKLKRERK